MTRSDTGPMTPSKADRKWVDRMVRAAKPMRLAHGVDCDELCRNIQGIRWLFLRGQAGPPAIPRRSEWERIEQAAATLLEAVAPFRPRRPGEVSLLPAGWWDAAPVGKGPNHLAVEALRAQAEKAIEADRRGGRPRVDHDFVVTAKLLLQVYARVFEGTRSRRHKAKLRLLEHGGADPLLDGPSPHPNSPAVRFVSEFFAGISEKWCDLCRTNPDGGAARFSVARTKPNSMPTLVFKALGRRITVGRPSGAHSKRTASGRPHHSIGHIVPLWPETLFWPVPADAPARE